MQSLSSIGDPQQSPSQFSNQSSNTFLAVPRMIDRPTQQQNQKDGVDNNSSYQTYPQQRHVSFQNPNMIQQQEKGESLEDQELLISKQSLDKRSIPYERDSMGPSNYQQSQNSSESYSRGLGEDRDEYRGLKQFHNQVDRIVRRNNGRLQLNRSRNSSDNMLDHPPKSKDSFKISPQFKPQDGLQLLQAQQLSSSRLQIDNVLDALNFKDNVCEFSGSPLSIEQSFLELNQATPRLINYKSNSPLQNWNKVTLIVVTFIARLFLAVRLPAEHNKFHLFKKKYFHLIGDSSSSFNFFTRLGLLRKTNNSEKRRKISPFYQFIEKYDLDKKYIIDPISQIRIFAIIAIYIYYIFGIFLIIYESSFKTEDNIFNQYFFFYVVCLDVCMTVNTAYFEDGKIIKSRNRIFQAHKIQFLEDLLVIIVLLLKINSYNKYFGFLIIIRFFRVKAFYKELNYIAELYFNLHVYFNICYLILQYLLIGHICACLLYIFDSNLGGQKDASNSDIYVTLLSWSLLTISTIGSNRLSLSNSQEQFFLILISIISFMFIFGTLYQILEMWNYITSNHQKKLSLTLQAYDKRGLSKNIQYSLRKYYDHHNYQQQTSLDDKRFWDFLSVNLRKEVSLNLYSKVIRTSKILKEICSDQCLDTLSTKFQYTSPEKGIMLLQQGAICDKLFFILSGELNQKIQLPSQSRQIRSFGFGPLDEYSFLMQTTRHLSYASKSLVQLGYIEYQDFYSVIKQYPEDFERLAMLKCNLSNNRTIINKAQVCQNCQYRGHFLQRCPFVHLVLDEEKILKEYNLFLPANRTRFFRNDNKRFNTRLNKNLISITAISFSISQRYHKEADLTNEVMNKLQGTHLQQDDSLFADVDEKTPRGILDRQYTSYSRQTDQLLQTLKSSQSNLGTNTQRQNSISLPNRMDNNEQLSIYSSAKNLSGSINSIKVNVIKSSMSSDHLLKQHEQMRLGNKKHTKRTDSLRREKKKVSYMSANPPMNPIQQQSTSMVHTINTHNPSSGQTYSNRGQQSSASPTHNGESGHVFLGESGHVINSEQTPLSSNQTAIVSNHNVGLRIDYSDCDRIQHYKYFFPSFNFDVIEIRVNKNNNKLDFIKEEFKISEKDIIRKKKFNTENTIVRKNDQHQYSMK